MSNTKTASAVIAFILFPWPIGLDRARVGLERRLVRRQLPYRPFVDLLNIVVPSLYPRRCKGKENAAV